MVCFRSIVPLATERYHGRRPQVQPSQNSSMKMMVSSRIRLQSPSAVSPVDCSTLRAPCTSRMKKLVALMESMSFDGTSWMETQGVWDYGVKTP
jgi:hypothetical protein